MIRDLMRRIERIGLQRFPVAGRLTLVFCGLVVFSMVVSLLLQGRALDRDLERAARERLARSAQAADRLLREHLLSVAERYAAVSRTPEFRANLEATGMGYDKEIEMVRLAREMDFFSSPYL